MFYRKLIGKSTYEVFNFYANDYGPDYNKLIVQINQTLNSPALPNDDYFTIYQLSVIDTTTPNKVLFSSK